MTPVERLRPGGLRIAHVVGTDRFAGTERYVIEVSTELVARGHRVTVVGGAPQPMRRLLPDAVRWLPGGRSVEALRSLARAGRHDLVHSHISKADFTALIAAPLTGGRRVSTRHITAPRGYDGASRRLAPLVRRLLARELVVSRYVADHVETVPDVVLVNGVRPAPDRDRAAEAVPRVVLMAQRLAPEKDTETGLRAWAASDLAGHGWRLVVAGEGEERSALEGLAAELGLSTSVDFVGWLADPVPAYRSAALLLAPAPTEPCGLVILEAMSHGLPVVAAGSGGTPETAGRLSDAALFPPGDAAAAAEHLRRLAADDEARDRYGRDLQRLQRAEMTLTAHVDRLEAVYRDALS